MTRALAAAFLVASLQIAAPAPAAAASLCSIGAVGIVPLPDGTTYALELTSPSETPVSVTFDLHSALSDYNTPPTTVAFKPITAAETKALQTPAHFISPPVFVSLPKFDTLLVARASVIGTEQAEACMPHAVLTSFYFRRDDANYQPAAAWVDWRQRVIDSHTADAAPLKASETPFRGATCDRPNARAQRTSVVKPIYPQIALQQGDSGVTVVEVHVDETGAFAGANVVSSSGSEVLDAAVLDAVHVATYKPASLISLHPDSRSHSIISRFS